MLFKKSKAVIAAALSVAMAANAMLTISASAAGTRTKPEAFGDSTYAERFLSLYDDVMTHGVENGFLSQNGASSNSFGIPYHAKEEVIIEAPDYGHETTSEAMSYLVWVAAMRDNIAQNHADLVGTSVTNTNDLAKAWKTMENMVPTVQENFWTADSVSATYCGEYDEASQCPSAWAAEGDKTAVNPLRDKFSAVYGSENGYYLMHWLADVENWYGYGSGTDFTFINTFQRGEQESCWETIPHPCVERLEYGMAGTRGLKGAFNTDAQVAKQYAYTNAPDAEDRAIQGVYDANRWGVGDSNVTSLAGKMGDQLRNNMYDKYYQAISEDTSTNSWANPNAGEASAHYLMNWYTSWGGALSQSEGEYPWVWQIGCSHAHEFYQNPLAAFALVADDGLKAGMKAAGAEADYIKSLERQMEFYLWLQSADGPIAGGATNSYKGRYLPYESNSTFYGMVYQEHPVYADPGSNHWIGNQVWAVQRLAELYYWVKTEGDPTGVQPGGMTLEAALEQILDKWCAWFVNNTILTTDGDFYMPSNLDWHGEPEKWGGSAPANTGLTCEITGYGNTDFGCISSLANTLIYYASAKGVTAGDIAGYTEASVGGSYAGGVDGVAGVGTTVYNTGDAAVPAVSLYLAQQLLDREWNIGRDDYSLTREDHNGAFARMFSQPVFVPTDYNGTMPNGDAIVNGATFISLRTMYQGGQHAGVQTSQEALDLVAELQAAYDADVAAGANWSGDYSASSAEGKAELSKFTNVSNVSLYYHRFWHAGDIMMALGVMAELYPDLKPDQTAEVTDPTTEPTTDETPTDDTDAPTEDNTGDLPELEVTLYGDVDVDDDVDIVDVIALNKYLLLGEEITDQGKVNADVDINKNVNATDSLNILKAVVKLVTLPV